MKYKSAQPLVLLLEHKYPSHNLFFTSFENKGGFMLVEVCPAGLGKGMG